MNKLLLMSVMMIHFLPIFGQVSSKKGQALKTPVQKNFFLGSFSFIQIDDYKSEELMAVQDGYKRMSGEGFRNFYTSYSISSIKPNTLNLQMNILPHQKKGRLEISRDKNNKSISILIKDSQGGVIKQKSFSKNPFSFQQDLNAIKTSSFCIEIIGKDGNLINIYRVEPEI